MDREKMLEEASAIDYAAAIARLAGETLSKEQQEMCKRFDQLYDELHREE